MKVCKMKLYINSIMTATYILCIPQHRTEVVPYKVPYKVPYRRYPIKYELNHFF